MPHRSAEGNSPAGCDGAGRGERDSFSLVRYAHIFSSAVREILEIKVLAEIGANGLSLSQFHLLKLICLNGHHQMGEVADFLGVTPPAATKNIDKLERLGLVQRTPSTEDRRATLLSSSAEGRGLVERYEAVKSERLDGVLEAFSAEELTQLSRLLERFSIALLRTEINVEGLCLRCSAYFDDRCPVQHLHEGCPYHKVIDGRSEKATEEAS